MQQYIGFRLEKSEYSVPILEIQEIIQVPQLIKMPQAPPYLAGVANLRGSIVPILNLKNLINVSGNGDQSGKVIVIAVQGNVFGILVDAITGVLNIDEAAIEPSDGLYGAATEQIRGVARLADRLVILLDTRKILADNCLGALSAPEEVTQISADQVEIIKTVHTMGGKVEFKEVLDVRDYFEKTGLSQADPRLVVLDDIMSFMQAISDQDLDKANIIVKRIIATGQSGLFQEVGKVTRKLHDSLLSFKESLDPRLKEITVNEMPSVVERLNYVIDKTREAADDTLGVAEKYLLKIDELGNHIRTLEGPAANIEYLKEFKSNLEDDLIKIITAQSFQDLTGQTIKKVIGLVNEIEAELVRVVKTFGISLDKSPEGASPGDKVSQSEVDDLLKTLGF
jgi:chemotaxis protein CheZ